jgi:hypothetical protein
MKKISIISLLCAALFAGACTRDIQGIDEVNDPSAPVGFVTGDAAGAATRGTPITAASQMTTMGVFASATGTSDWTATATLGKMFNQKLNGDNGVWSYLAGDEVYWEATTLADRYSFFAYAPYGSTDNGIVVDTSDTTGVPTLTYTVPTDVTKQPDLMVATKKNMRPTGAKVPLAMEHALTSVAFQIKGNGEKVKAIAIQGVSQTGTLAVDGETITWSNLGTPTTTDFSASLNYDTTGDGAGLYYTTTENMSTNLIAGNGYLMMIPQTLTADAKVTVTYSDDTTKELALSSVTWAAGDRLTYNITLTLDGGQADILYFGANNRLTIGRWGVDVADIEDMVFTQFGSVVGFTNGTSWDSGDILFNPTATDSYAYNSIPNFTGTSTSTSVSDPAYHNGTNILAGRGDICKLVGLTSAQAKAMADAGTLDAFESGWRLPTIQENRVFIGTTPDDPSTSFGTSTGYYTWTPNGGTAASPGTGTFPKNKYQPGVTLPAAGSRLTDGSVSNPGTNGYYWSSIALNSNSGYSLNLSSSLVGPSYSSSYAFGMANRCISTGEEPTPLLSVDPAAITVAYTAGTDNTSTVTTNVATGWTAVSNATWITLTDAQGATGEDVIFSVAANPSTTASRTGTVTVSAGTAAPVTITVTQSGPTTPLNGVLAPPGVIGYIAGTNTLTLRGSKEYADADADANGNNVNDFVEFAKTIHPDGLETETVYAAYFKFGSLIAISGDPTDSESPYLESDDLIAGPTEYTGWDALVASPTWGGIPVYNTTDYTFQDGAGNYTKRNVSHADYQTPTSGKGDPCMYYFGTDGWKLPTGNPYNGTPDYDTSNLTWKAAGNLGTGLPSGRLSTRTGEIGWFYPAAGYRYDSNGDVFNQGASGYYWSSTAASRSGGYSLYFNNLDIYPSYYNFGYAYGVTIRCVPPPPTIAVTPNWATFVSEGETKTFTVTTTNFTGTPTVTAIDDATGNTAAWITSASVSGTTLTVTAAKNTASTSRTATLTLTAGTATATVAISQRGTLWGGENHVLYFTGNPDRPLAVGRWDTSLTAEDRGLGVIRLTDANNDRDRLAFFKFGSVIGFTRIGNYPDPWDNSYILFNPSDLVVGTDITGFGDESNSLPAIPAFSGSDWKGSEAATPLISDRVNYHTEANLRGGKGDPCMLAGIDMTKLDEPGYLANYDSGWRLPTKAENRMFIGVAADDDTSAFYASSSPEYYQASPASSWSNSTPGTGIFPANTVREEDPRLPAAGTRYCIDGIVNGWHGVYWASTVANQHYGSSLSFIYMVAQPSDESFYNITNGASIRCVHP